MLASERFSRQLHSRDLSRYRVARRNTIVVDPMLLWDGSIGLQNVVDEGLVSPDYRVFNCSARADPAFMGYVVRSGPARKHYQNGARGTNVRRNRIARSDFLRIPLLLPPVPEQVRIAVILSSVESAVARAEAVVEQLGVLCRAMRDQLLHECAGAGLRPLKDISVLITKGTTPTTYGHDYTSSGIPFLRVENITDGGDLRLGEVKYISGDTHRFLLRSQLRPGDVLLSIAGALGKAAVVPDAVAEANINQAVALIRTKPEVVSPSYLKHALLGPQVRDQVDLGRSQLAQANLNLAQVGDLQIPIPPQQMQERVAEVLDAVQDRQRREAEVLEQLRVLKAALVSSLVSGETRVVLDEVDT